MTTYFTSDWHLGHAKILELSQRPFADVYQMNRVIIERCNDMVRENDTLIMLGDTLMGTYALTLQRFTTVRCKRIVMIPGNHDRWSLAYRGTDTRRAEIRTQLINLGLFPQPDREPSQWASTILDQPVLLSHYPYVGDSGERDRHTNLRPVDEGLPLIHGHVHNLWKMKGRMLNVGVDVWDYAPVSEQAVGTWLLNLPKEAPS